MRKELFLTDLAKLAQPQANISPDRALDKWEPVSYETTNHSGTMLVALKDVRPEPLTFTLGLSGWYHIYVCLPAYGSHMSFYTQLQLTGDPSYTQFCPGDQARGKLEEVYWKSADLSNQDLILSKHKGALDHDSMLAWLRFVPMTDAEVAAYRQEQQRQDTKRIYATHDMHGHLYMYNPQSLDDWLCILENYRDSDVASLAMENVTSFDGPVTAGDIDSQGFFRSGDSNVQKGLSSKHYSFDLLNQLVQHGQQMGLEMYLSMRMGAWGIDFPYDKMYFANQFYENNPELRCVDRLGQAVETMSYIYPEVQDYLLDHFIKMAETDCDGVEMIFTRGVPYVLYEQPFLELFRATYGDDLDPRQLPIADPRVHNLFCQVITDFVARLRKKIDAVRAAQGKKPLKLIARVHSSIENGRLVGIDVAEWAKQKLIDVIVSYPMLIAENLDADVWADKEQNLLDLAKYKKYVRSTLEAPIIRAMDFEYEDEVSLIKKYSNGDPLTEKDRIASFAALGLPVYYEILPRYMTPAEYQQRALNLYKNGAEGISLWDTYNRVLLRQQWSMVRRLGHKEELANFTEGQGEVYQHYPVLKINGKNISMYKPMWGG